jgi:hypothetical protein
VQCTLLIKSLPWDIKETYLYDMFSGEIYAICVSMLCLIL